MRIRIVALALLASAGILRADQTVENVQQALKGQGFYYGEITGQKDADTTAAIRRYQIRNGLQVTGDLNDETLKAFGADASSSRAVVKASPSASPAAPETSDLRAERRASETPTNPLTGQPFPDVPQDRSAQGQIRRGEQPPVRPNYEAVPGRPAENFAGTPYESAPPEVQRNVIVSAQNILARRELYRGVIDGFA